MNPTVKLARCRCTPSHMEVGACPSYGGRMMPGQEPYTDDEYGRLVGAIGEAAEGDPGEEGEAEAIAWEAERRRQLDARRMAILDGARPWGAPSAGPRPTAPAVSKRSWADDMDRAMDEHPEWFYPERYQAHPIEADRRDIGWEYRREAYVPRRIDWWRVLAVGLIIAAGIVAALVIYAGLVIGLSALGGKP